MHYVPELRKAQPSGRVRAADDFTFIKHRLTQLEAERRVSGSARTGTTEWGSVDVVRNQQVPEDLGIINGGSDHLVIRRDGGRRG